MVVSQRCSEDHYASIIRWLMTRKLLYQPSDWRIYDLCYSDLFETAKTDPCCIFMEGKTESVRSDRNRGIHPSYRLPSAGPPVGRNEIRLVQRTYHCSFCSVRRPHHRLYRYPSMERRICHSASAYRTAEKRRICCTVRLFPRIFILCHCVLCAYLVPGH